MAYDELTAKLVSENAALRAEVAETTEEFGKLSHDLAVALLENERLRAALDLVAKGRGDPVAVACAALAQEKPHED